MPAGSRNVTSERASGSGQAAHSTA
jgi:hypothetical protein